MNKAVQYQSNKASEAEIAEHLARCDADFEPSLSSRVEIMTYARLISRKAVRFEAWSGDTLIGLVAAYFNDQESGIAYITSVSVLKAWTNKGVAAHLVSLCIVYAKAVGMWQLSLEVASTNASAVNLYKRNGFVTDQPNGLVVRMHLFLSDRKEHE